MRTSWPLDAAKGKGRTRFQASKGNSPVDALTLAQGNRSQASDLHPGCWGNNLQCLKPLSVRSPVTAAVGNSYTQQRSQGAFSTLSTALATGRSAMSKEPRACLLRLIVILSPPLPPLLGPSGLDYVRCLLPLKVLRILQLPACCLRDALWGPGRLQTQRSIRTFLDHPSLLTPPVLPASLLHRSLA